MNEYFIYVTNVLCARKGISQSSLPYRRSVPTVFIFLYTAFTFSQW